MITSHLIFKIMVAIHIISGSVGLVTFWVPVIAKKGGINHRKWGKIFVWAMIVTGTVAVGIATTTIFAPVETHPHLIAMPEFENPEMIRAIFGWMMLYLAILTVNLAWYGKLCIDNKRDHPENRAWHNMALQVILFVAAANCFWEGIVVAQPLMMGISMVGFATVATNLWFMLKKQPGAFDWQLEHIKGLVGAGISVYTAFFAFGAVRLLPELALTPALWAVPLVTGISLIIYHQAQVRRRFIRPAALRAAERVPQRVTPEN